MPESVSFIHFPHPHININFKLPLNCALDTVILAHQTGDTIGFSLQTPTFTGLLPTPQIGWQLGYKGHITKFPPKKSGHHLVVKTGVPKRYPIIAGERMVILSCFWSFYRSFYHPHLPFWYEQILLHHPWFAGESLPGHTAQFEGGTAEGFLWSRPTDLTKIHGGSQGLSMKHVRLSIKHGSFSVV